MRGTVMCTICAALQAGRRHRWLSYGHRIGYALTAKMWSPPNCERVKYNSSPDWEPKPTTATG
jgi:hypothetical protein